MGSTSAGIRAGRGGRSWAFPSLSTWWTLSPGGDACAAPGRAPGVWSFSWSARGRELCLPRRSCSEPLFGGAASGGCFGGLGALPGAPRASALLPAVPAVLKKRLVKLVVNFLFYFRTDEAEPIGALLLEHCKITKEEENVFSISFIEEPERKYCFECATEEQCQEWVEALKRASYEFLRRSLIFYRNEIQKMTGKDPLEQYGISEEARFQLGAHRQ
ncbi:pleckstrin homology domain-containing family J member 1 isoform X1 [Chamaea fasciata]|uniref:pleckstrin homology domain-containing family J member 1 isoform X1 n=1 Tax=Chamaea fasciata TaxID=190680 RepID=UPI00336AC23B